MNEDKERLWVKLVVYVLLKKDGKILLGKRKNTFGAGCYSMPAGHIEKGETVFECAKRELFEETEIDAEDFDFLCVRLMKPFELDKTMADPYVAFCVTPKSWLGEPMCAEPEKNEGWEWFPLDELPKPLFPPVGLLLECIRKSVNFID